MSKKSKSADKSKINPYAEQDAQGTDPVEQQEEQQEEVQEEVAETVQEPEVAVEPAIVVVPEKPKTAPKKEQQEEVSAFDKKIDKVLKSGLSGEKLIVEYFTNYIKAMSPGKPVEPRDGARHQQNIWRIIALSINNEAEFKECLDLIMAYFKEYNNTVFYDTHIYRFIEEMTLGEDQRRSFLAVTTLFKVAAGTKNRKEIKKHIDLSRAMDGVFDEPARQRMISYFS